MAILSNEYVLGGIIIGLIVGGGLIWTRSRSFFNNKDPK